MKVRQTLTLLQSIQTELVRLQLWSATPPDAKSMASQAPFCCDTMPLQQWLQFIFIPRMHALIEAHAALPQQISICPIAEEAFQQLGTAALPLINRIADLDELLSGKREQTVARI